MSAFGKKLDNQAQDLAYSIYLFFKKRCENPHTTEYQQNMKLFPTVSKATGLPEKTLVKLVMKRDSKSDNSYRGNKLLMKRYLVLDNIAKCDIKRRVIQFYSQYQKVPTLKTIHKTFMREKVLVTTISYLERLLKEVGFKHHNLDGQSEQKLFMERSSLVSTRRDYLQSMNKYRDNGRTIIFVGETYVSATQKAGEEDIEVFQNSKEGGFIVLHACDSKAFVKGALLIIQSKFNRKQYLNDMTSDNFTWWVKENLLPNVPPQSVIVMMNASYNSDAVKPTYKCTKPEFEAWLKKHNIPFKENLAKIDLLALVNNHQSSGDSELDELIKNNGHDVLRIPAAHADLNVMEWILRNVKKRHWTGEQLTSTMDLKQLTLELTFASCTESDLQQCHDEVNLLLLEYSKHDAKLDQTTEEMLEKIRKKEIPLEDEEDSDSQEEMEISDEEN